MLSGFVIGYAYDDRWGKMSVKDFFKRRLIRLHPPVIIGALFGAITYLIQGSVMWNGTSVSGIWVLVSLLMSMLLIPALPGSGYEVRGSNEIFPLNGPSWTLFFEYIANIIYALVIRRFSTLLLTLLVAATGAGLAYFAIGNLSGYYNLGVGWSFIDNNILGGSLRLMFSFSAGLLVSRVYKPMYIKGAFWIAAASIVVLLSLPYIGCGSASWLNGLYESVVVIAIFPLLIFLGASDPSNKADGNSKFRKLYRFLGDISYPLYIVHYPFMYLFYSWTWGSDPRLTFGETWPVTLLLFFGNIALAYIVMKIYDIPVRRWLTKRFIQAR